MNPESARTESAWQTLLTQRLFDGVERPVACVAEKLRPHQKDIHTSWRGMLRDRLKLSASEIRTLAALRIDLQRHSLKSEDLKSYAVWLEEQGDWFERRSVPMDRAVAALALYFEACMPFLDFSTPIPASALVRFICASEFCLILGFSRHRQEKWKEMEEKLINAEQRLRRFSVHVVSAYEQTGRRIARDLHDEIGHNLLVLKLYLDLMNMDLKEGHPDQVIPKLDEAVVLIGHAIDGVRRLAFNLGPSILEEAGFIPTIRRYAKQFTDRTGIKAHFNIQLTVKLPSIFEVTLYRVLQGALSNVVEHSRAQNVRVGLRVRRGMLMMSIQDDGRGFDIKKRLRNPNQAFGLLAIRQRVELLGGKLRIESHTRRTGRLGPGTSIELEIPLEDIEAA